MTPCRCWLPLLALLFFAAPAPADDVTDKIDAVFAKYDKPDAPGCAVAVYLHGKIFYKHGYGEANVEKKIPMTPEHVFELASMSKQFTAMSIALLEEEGKLSFDDPIRKFLPDLHECMQPVTIRHLVHHEGGIPDYMELMGNDDWTRENALKELSKVKKLLFKPGDKYDYSNSGYVLLAWIVRKASGQGLREFAEKHIFEPLGMKHTTIRDSKDVRVPNRATGYSKKKNGALKEDMELDNYIAGDGSVMTTVEDLFFWDQNFYHNKLGKGGEALIRTVLTRGELNDGKKTDYAFGLEEGKYRGLHTVRHEGLWAGFGTDILRFPDQEFTVVCLANCSATPSDELDNKVADIVLAEDFKDRAKEKK
jgi:CubicO group peptidase (beta-lactamase class C family)